MFGRAVKPENRAHVVTVRNVWIGIVSTLVALISGRFLDQIPFPINYQILFVIGFATSLVSVYYLAQIRLPVKSNEMNLRTADSPKRIRDWAGLLGNRAYARFTIASFVFHWGMFFAQPLYSIYWVRTLRATDGWVGLLTMVGSAMTIVCYPLWSRLTTRHGTEWGLAMATLGLAVYPLATLLSPGIEWIIPVQLLGGVTSSGYGLTFFNRLLEVSPEPRRPSYVAGYTALINIAAFASPLIATGLTGIFDIRILLLVAAALRFLGPLLFWRPRRFVR
jgi:Na+/melibiose symporter-like transporter